MAGKLSLNVYTALKALATRTVEMQCDRVPYRFENVPLKKLLNWIRVEASIYAKPQQPWGLPTHLQVEPTNRCNLRCTLCPVSRGLGRPSGFMELELFERFIDEVCEHAFLLLLWEWGEPFVHPQICDMISYARKKGLKVVVSTNGQRLADPDYAEKVVRSGLDTLIFAMDGTSQATYERYRQHGNLETLLQGIRTVVAKKKELGSSTPLVNLRFIVMGYNEHEVPGLDELARSLGVDLLSLKTLYPGHDCDPSEDQHNAFIPKNPSYRRFRYADDGKTRIRVQQNPCKCLWNNPSIHWNGTVCSCSFDVHERHGFGNLHTDSFADIWGGDSYVRRRRQFREDWETTPLCTGCSYAYEGGSCATDTIVEAVFINQDPP